MAAGILTLIAGVAVGGGSAHAATRAAAASAATSFATTHGALNAVAATTAGQRPGGRHPTFGHVKTLIMGWNGGKWS